MLISVIRSEEEKEEDKENEEDDEEEKCPPLMYSQFSYFMFLLKHYFILCKIFKNNDIDENWKVAKTSLDSDLFKQEISLLPFNDDVVEEVTNILNSDEDHFMFEDLTKQFLTRLQKN